MARLSAEEVIADAAGALPAALAPVAAVDRRQTDGSVVVEQDLGLEPPFVAAGDVAAQERGAPQLVLLLPAEHASLRLPLAGSDDRGGQAGAVAAGDAAVGR